MAGQFLKAATVSTENAVALMKLTQRQIQVSMFAAGAENIAAIQNIKLRQE
jgi:isopentenyl diphosphate isomerase/L-lactate dehydrogenase-like FMN-dependent dehydrogenase